MKSQTPHLIKPVKIENRILYLDILRGIAVFFILTANIYFFSGWMFFSNAMKEGFASYSINHSIEYITDLLINAKFYSIFSILFGIGFVIQYNNLQKYKSSFSNFFRRRMAGLLLFGILHLFFLWMGDILSIYALVGFILIYFRNHANKQLLKWAAFLLFLPVIHLLILIITGAFYPMILFNVFDQYWTSLGLPVHDFRNTGTPEPDILYFLQTNNFSEFFDILIRTPILRLAIILIEGRIFKVLACFLIGMWAGRQILNNNLLENIRLLKKIVVLGFIIGIPMNILMVYSKGQGRGVWTLVDYLSNALGVVPLACAYAAAIALWLRLHPKFLTWFAPVGRMALSNYILQTIVCIGIFYGIGLGYAGTLPLWKVMIITIVIFIGQIILSTYWLQRFKYGPLEWLWRKITYGTLVHTKKQVS